MTELMFVRGPIEDQGGGQSWEAHYACEHVLYCNPPSYLKPDPSCPVCGGKIPKEYAIGYKDVSRYTYSIVVTRKQLQYLHTDNSEVQKSIDWAHKRADEDFKKWG